MPDDQRESLAAQDLLRVNTPAYKHLRHLRVPGQREARFASPASARRVSSGSESPLPSDLFARPLRL